MSNSVYLANFSFTMHAFAFLGFYMIVRSILRLALCGKDPAYDSTDIYISIFSNCALTILAIIAGSRLSKPSVSHSVHFATLVIFFVLLIIIAVLALVNTGHCKIPSSGAPKSVIYTLVIFDCLAAVGFACLAFHYFPLLTLHAVDGHEEALFFHHIR